MELSAKGLGAAVETAARRSLRRRMPAPLFKAPDDIPPSLSLVNYPQLSYDVQVSGGSPDFSQGLDWKLGVEPGLISALISALFSSFLPHSERSGAVHPPGHHPPRLWRQDPASAGHRVHLRLHPGPRGRKWSCSSNAATR